MVAPERIVGSEEALARLGGETVGPLARVHGAFARYRVERRAPPRVAREVGYRKSARAEDDGGADLVASPRVSERAAARGLRYLGRYGFFGLFGYLPRDLWVTSDGTVRLSARRAHGSIVERAMAPYTLTTVFDDATAITTWGGAPVPTSPRATERAGTGDLDTDLAAHEAAVQRHLDGASTCRALCIASVADANALSRYFEVHLAGRSAQTASLRMRGCAYALALACVWTLVSTLVGTLR